MGAQDCGVYSLRLPVHLFVDLLDGRISTDSVAEAHSESHTHSSVLSFSVTCWGCPRDSDRESLFSLF